MESEFFENGRDKSCISSWCMNAFSGFYRTTNTIFNGKNKRWGSIKHELFQGLLHGEAARNSGQAHDPYQHALAEV